jgi:hypothetical protein
MADPTPKLSAPVSPEKKLDTVDLWKYFESRGQELKTAMIALSTWLTGFMAATLAFSLEKAIKFDAGSVRVSNPLLLVLMGIIGLGLVIYALIVVYEYVDHINRAFARSDRVRDLDTSLDPILTPRKPKPHLKIPKIWAYVRAILRLKPEPTPIPKICAHVRDVVWAFGVAFAFLLLLGLVAIFGGCR